MTFDEDSGNGDKDPCDEFKRLAHQLTSWDQILRYQIFAIQAFCDGKFFYREKYEN